MMKYCLLMVLGLGLIACIERKQQDQRAEPNAPENSLVSQEQNPEAQELYIVGMPDGGDPGAIADALSRSLSESGGLSLATAVTKAAKALPGKPKTAPLVVASTESIVKRLRDQSIRRSSIDSVSSNGSTQVSFTKVKVPEGNQTKRALVFQGSSIRRFKSTQDIKNIGDGFPAEKYVAIRDKSLTNIERQSDFRTFGDSADDVQKRFYTENLGRQEINGENYVVYRLTSQIIYDNE